MKKIVHIITGLGSGGAENMLHKLLKYSDEDKYYHEVISLMDEGVYGKKIEDLGIKVHCLDLNKKNILKSLMKSRKICKGFDIINTWLYHADIFGFVVSKVLLRKKLIWNIRHSNLDKDVNKSSTLKIVKLNSFISKYVNSITYNSNKALETHTEVGYKNERSVVISNGFELDKFKFSLDDRLRVRKNLGLIDDKIIITVGRWDIQKDYYTLLKSLNELKKIETEFKMLMVGTNLDTSNKELMKLIDNYNLKNNIILLGRRDDIPELLSAADIYVSSSLGESFSNSIGEAMACELPCVVTNVGDSKLMVGDTGKVVESGDYMDMSRELFSYVEKKDLGRNSLARDRVIKNYGIEAIVEKISKNINNCI